MLRNCTNFDLGGLNSGQSRYFQCLVSGCISPGLFRFVKKQRRATARRANSGDERPCLQTQLPTGQAYLGHRLQFIQESALLGWAFSLLLLQDVLALSPPPKLAKADRARAQLSLRICDSDALNSPTKKTHTWATPEFAHNGRVSG